MSQPKDELWEQLGDPVNLPLVVAVPAGYVDNPSLIGASTPTTLQVQMNTQAGQHLFLSLTVEAARQLLVTLASMPPIQGFLSELKSGGPTTTH